MPNAAYLKLGSASGGFGQRGQISIFPLEAKPITNLAHSFVIGFGLNGKIEI
jgi:hypothetical protein